MSEAGELVHLLMNLPVSELIGVLERDGFTLRRSTRTGGRIYMHEDGRLTVVQRHSDTQDSQKRTRSGQVEPRGCQAPRPDLKIATGVIPWYPYS